MTLERPGQDLDEFFWSDLLDYIEAGRVLPVVDTGAFVLEGDGPQWTAETRVARRLADWLRLQGLTAEPRLDDVVRAFQRSGQRKDVLYGRALKVAKELALAPPATLRALAGIPAFRLFVSVGVDDLLTQALDAVRHGGEPRTDVIAYAPHRPDDLPASRTQLARTTVYHLMGRLSTVAGECVICDEDRLEFLHALQDDTSRPKLLFDELRDCHLLLLGCPLPDWAARFLLRTSKDAPLSMRRQPTYEYVIDPALANDAGMQAFVADFSPHTRLVGMSPAAFLSELHAQWCKRHPAGRPSSVPVAPAAAPMPPDDGSVFISYSREDSVAAERLARALTDAGVEVWFDRQDLKAGDPWEAQIRRGIEQCAAFVPLISLDTLNELRWSAFFWSEWNSANDRAARLAPLEPWLMPVVIDKGIDAYRARVPDRFTTATWTTLIGGHATPEFLATVKARQRTVRDRLLRMRGA